MKLVKKLTAIAMSSLLMFSIVGMNVFAASTTQDGLEVSLTTDKETYLKDEKITATLSVTNTNDEDITNLSMETIIPDGYYILDNGNTDLSATVLKSKESVSLSAEFVPDSFRIEPVKTDTDEKTSEERPTKDDKPNVPSTAKSITPAANDNNVDDANSRNVIVDTSDSSLVNIIMCIVLICVSAFVIILLVKRKSGKRFLSFVVCISLIGSVAAIIPIKADALQTQPRSVSIEESVKANGTTLTLSANVRYEISGENLFKGDNSDEQVIVYFFKPDDWDDPYLNFYSADSDKDSAVFADMQEVSDGWYGYKIENCKTAKIAFADKLTRIPENDEEWLDAKGIMWYKNDVWCNSDTDTDKDDLPDYMELLLGTNINNPDSDGDKLPDGFEALILGTDPSLADTDDNNVADADEDADSDGLTNIFELQIGTDPTLADTDGDRLYDGDEVNKHHTEPLNPDSDGDGASDGWENNNGYDPLTPNSSFMVTIKAEDKENNLNASVTAEVSGSQAESLSAEFLESTFYLNSTIEGYIGKGLELSVNDEVNDAELEFIFDEGLLDNDDFVPAIYYYNEETQCLEELETTTTGNVSTAHLTHFSTYILLNKTEFEKVWKNEIKKPGETVYENIRVAFVVDCSGSMDSKLSDTKAVLNSFVNILDERDKAAVICFDSSALVACDLTNDKNQLQNAINGIYASGLTSIYLGIEKALDLLISDSSEYYDLIIVITDGYDVPSTTYNSHYSSLVNTAQSHNINIYTVGIGSVDTSILTQISANTNATYYHANVISELENKIEDIKEETIDYTTDYNEDGITDYYTKKLTSGELRYGTHAFVFGTYDNDGNFHPATYEQVQANDDFDDDSLINGEEIKIVTDSLGHPYVKFNSDPSNEDSDGDGLLDGKPVYYNGFAIAPTDPHTLTKDGSNNLWRTHIQQITDNEKVSSNYSNDYYEPIMPKAELKFWGIIPYLDNNYADFWASCAPVLGSVALDFRYDDQHIALHSDTTQWQAIGGYNDFYDWIFNLATSMDKVKLRFKSGDKNYVIWAWKGNYLNLGAGAEVGFYTQNDILENLDDNFHLEQWMVDGELPMSLSLYRKVGTNLYLNCYHWFPYLEQWWITGFVPNIYDYSITAEELIQISSVDFSENPEMLKELKQSNDAAIYSDNLIFDMEDNKLWIVF